MMLKLTTISITFFFLALLSGPIYAQAKFADGYEAAQSGNFKKAVQIWKTLAEKGNVDAQYSLGWMYESGQGVKKNYKMAASWYQRAAKQGDNAAQYVLATMYAKGSGVSKSDEKALELFILAANQGDAISQFQVGNYYQHGIGIPKDDKKSLIWYQKSAQQGHLTAQINLGHMYQSGRGVKQDYKEAIKWYESASNQNNALAQYQLAHMYEYGWGEKQNNEKAIELYTKSAKNNYSQSAYKLGLIYELGQGVDVDFDQATKWYRQAALQANTNAQFKLGYLSQSGKGTEKNIQVAMEWYRQASRREHAQAHFQLAKIYQYGTTEFSTNIPENLQKAFEHYQRASTLNYHLAHARLAYFYELGIFTKSNKSKAITLYKQAPQPWAGLRLERLIKHQNCLNTASTRLFTELISCVSRPLLRQKIVEQKIKVINENNSGWSDTYFTGAMIKGSSELTVSYTRDNLLAQATYTFVGRNNPELVERIKNKLAERYGNPTSSEGNVLVGKASFQWVLKDNIILNVYRHWPDTTTFVEYVQPENLALQAEQQKESMDKLFQSEAQRKREPDAPISTTLF